MVRKRKGRCTKRNKQHLNTDEPEELKRAPHSFVFQRGSVGHHVLELIKDFRKVMEPFTASSLKARKKNSIKDFVSVSGLLHVTHLCVFTQTKLSTYLKIVRLPRGPTLTFKIHNYSLARDVLSTLKKQLVFNRQFENSPLIILNGFSGEGMHIKLLTSMFQNMFPTINVMKVNLNDIRRCVLVNYEPSSKLMDFRHYAIKVVPTGISKSVKKIVQSKVPDLSKYTDISEFITKPSQLSESEGEDDPASHVVLPQKLSSRGNSSANTSAIRMLEIGPRLTLQLIKVEDGVLGGEVLYHELVHKTEEAKELIKKRRDEKRKLKEMRQKVQEENRKKKEEAKGILKEKSLKGMYQRSERDIQMRKAVAEANENEDDDDDDDSEWYRQEVGEEPSKDLFDSPTVSNVKRKKSETFVPYKKKKPSGFHLTQKSEGMFKKKIKKDSEGSSAHRRQKSSQGGAKFSKKNTGVKRGKITKIKTQGKRVQGSKVRRHYKN